MGIAATSRHPLSLLARSRQLRALFVQAKQIGRQAGSTSSSTQAAQQQQPTVVVVVGRARVLVLCDSLKRLDTLRTVLRIVACVNIVAVCTVCFRRRSLYVRTYVRVRAKNVYASERVCVSVSKHT